MGRRGAAGAAALAAALGLAAGGCTDRSTAGPKIQSTVRPGVAPTPPAKGAYFGAWVPAGTESPSSSPSGAPPESPSGAPSAQERLEVGAVTEFERAMGRRLDIAAAYRTWKQQFPRPSDTELLAGGRYLLLTWSGTDTKEIVAGRHDGYLRERARAVKALGKPIFLRWQPGMDRQSQRDKIHSAADFIAAWKHVREVFRQERADNVAWVWCPTAGGFGGGNAPSLYPGDDQVDWICADVFPGADYEYRDFADAAQLFFKWAADRPKPIMIAEFGVPKAYGTRRAEWFRNAARNLQNPQVKAVVYFDSDEDADSATDTRHQYALSGDGPALAGLRELATAPYFNPRNLPVSSG